MDQLPLEIEERCLENAPLVASNRKVRHRKAKDVTFKGGRDSLAHRWFRLTPSFSPHLVGHVLDRYGNPESRVLDPFSGRGTTPIECQLRGVKCVGAEINPALHFAATTSLDWSVGADELAAAFDAVCARVESLKANSGYTQPEHLATELGVVVPPIHNVYRWWRAPVLGELMLVKYVIEGSPVAEAIKRKMLLALSSILLDAANITLGRLQLHFIDRSAVDIQPLALFRAAADIMCADMRSLEGRNSYPRAEIHLTDNRELHKFVGEFRADMVITSPPYPNRYSYVWNTRPHLYFLEWVTQASEASRLDCQTIGGTWGTATSRHQKGEYTFRNDAAAAAALGIVEEIRPKDLMMSNYVAMYFDDLYSSITETRRCLTGNAICAYVVGNSRAKGSVVETDLILGEMFRNAGFRLLGIEELRRRNSGKELHETVVFAQNDRA